MGGWCADAAAVALVVGHEPGRDVDTQVRGLVACFGNVLRGDDGFGAAVAAHLSEAALPATVRVLELGIGGIHLVHELTDEIELLVVVDAIDLGRPAGQVVVQRPDVVDVWTLSATERRDELADMHFAVPARALMLARALEVLPAQTWLVGCQLVDDETLGAELSPAVAAGVAPAGEEVVRLLAEHGLLDTQPSDP